MLLTDTQLFLKNLLIEELKKTNRTDRSSSSANNIIHQIPRNNNSLILHLKFNSVHEVFVSGNALMQDNEVEFPFYSHWTMHNEIRDCNMKKPEKTSEIIVVSVTLGSIYGQQRT